MAQCRLAQPQERGGLTCCDNVDGPGGRAARGGKSDPGGATFQGAFQGSGEAGGLWASVCGGLAVLRSFAFRTAVLRSTDLSRGPPTAHTSLVSDVRAGVGSHRHSQSLFITSERKPEPCCPRTATHLLRGRHASTPCPHGAPAGHCTGADARGAWSGAAGPSHEVLPRRAWVPEAGSLRALPLTKVTALSVQSRAPRPDAGSPLLGSDRAGFREGAAALSGGPNAHDGRRADSEFSQ